MDLAVMVGTFVMQVVREWCPSTTRPLLPTITEWVGYVVPGGVLPPFHTIVARTERRVQRTLPCGPYSFGTKSFGGHRGGMGVCNVECSSWPLGRKVPIANRLHFSVKRDALM